jgi:hypothetical protein
MLCCKILPGFRLAKKLITYTAFHFGLPVNGAGNAKISISFSVLSSGKLSSPPPKWIKSTVTLFSGFRLRIHRYGESFLASIPSLNSSPYLNVMSRE